MPGTIEEYMSDDNTQRAIDIIDQAISEQKPAAEILNDLSESGLRVYTSEDTGEMPEEGVDPLEMAGPEGMEEAPEELDPMALEEGADMPPPSDLGPGLEPRSGEEGGMRDMRIDAVRFALDKDKKNREQSEEELV
jgi:hypothetical protein